MSENKTPTRGSFMQTRRFMRIIGWIGLLLAIYLIFFDEPENRFTGYLLLLLSVLALYRDFSRRREEEDKGKEDEYG